jgi:demethylmenaquinone methyltransferase/2-methoxy-6-polyprenyl-1,4-benzoquinol methylase
VNRNIQRIFGGIPSTYERVNRVLTFGLDRRWRRKAVEIAVEGGGLRWLDVCSGTGETAMMLREKTDDRVEVFVADFSLPMIREALKKPEAGKISFTLADVAQLPFPDNSIDLITISFATRNIDTSRNALTSCFREFYRVLNREGRFVNLETSQPPSRIVRWLVHLYVKLFVRAVGRVISGSDPAYAYLSSTIPRFYTGEELAGIMSEAGFEQVSFRRMLFGVTAIHKAVKKG